MTKINLLATLMIVVGHRLKTLVPPLATPENETVNQLSAFGRQFSHRIDVSPDRRHGGQPAEI